MLSFTVKGSGKFPLDMLRYDRCFPATNNDVIVMVANDYTEERTIKLVTDSPRERPTVERWRSFGWEVER